MLHPDSQGPIGEATQQPLVSCTVLVTAASYRIASGGAGRHLRKHETGRELTFGTCELCEVRFCQLAFMWDMSQMVGQMPVIVNPDRSSSTP